MIKTTKQDNILQDGWTIGDPQGKSTTYINPECTKKFRGINAVRRFLKGEKAKKNDWFYTKNEKKRLILEKRNQVEVEL